MPATPNPLNNTVGTATNLLLSSGLPQTVSGFLSSTDEVDYYRFTTTAASDLKLVMNGLSGDAKLSVFQSNGSTPLTPGAGAGNTTSTNNSGLLSEAFVFNNLAVGTYVIKVERETPTVTTAEYRLEALASVNATANSLLWQQTPLTNSSPLAISWLLNGGNLIGQASPSAAQNPDFAGLQYLDSGDFDGDKVQDILWKKDLGGSYQLFTWFMNSDNTLRESKGVSLSTNATGATFTIPNAFEIKRVEDFNGEGRADILFRNADVGSIIIWKMDGSVVDMNFGSTFSNFNLLDYSVVGTGDFDGNGVRDVLFRNGGVMVNWLLQTTGNQFSLIQAPAGQPNAPGQSGLIKTKTGVTITQLTSEWELVGVGDFDKTFATNPSLADDRDDMLFLNRVSGQMVAWLMNGSEIEDSGLLLNGAVISGDPGIFSFVGLGDFNGDSNLDMLWRSKASPDLVVWQMNGKDIDLPNSGYVRLNSQNVNFLTPNLQIVTRNNLPGERRLVDFNSNKQADVLFRDTSTGRLILWEMNGRTVDPVNNGFVKNSDGSIPAVPAADFQVIGGLTTELLRSAQATAGTEFSTAFNMGVLNTGSLADPTKAANYQDSVRNLGTSGDYYKFKLERSSDIALKLLTARGATTAANATFEIFKDDLARTPVALTPAQKAGTITLDSGSYFIKVTSTGAVGVDVNYNLNIVGEPNVINFKSVALATVEPVNPALKDAATGQIILADLDPGTTSTTPDSAKPKTKVSIAYTLTNTEVKTAPTVDVSFYLSRVPTINVLDAQNTKFLGKQTLTNIVGNSQDSPNVFEVDLPPGDNNIWTTDTNYYIGYVIDYPDLIPETFELNNPGQTDNISPIKTVAIKNTQTPDLLGKTLTTSATSITRGGTINLNYVVENIGKRATGSFPGADNLRVDFYLYRASTDANLTLDQRNALDIGDSLRTSPVLASVIDGDNILPIDIPGSTATASKSIQLQLPGANSSFWNGATAGTQYFIGMVTEAGDVIVESKEGNALAGGNNFNLGLGVDRVAVTLA